VDYGFVGSSTADPFVLLTECPIIGSTTRGKILGMHVIVGLAFLVAAPIFGVALPKTTPVKSCSFSTLSASQMVDRSQTILAPGIRSVDTSTLQPIRKGRITNVFTGSLTTDGGEVKPAIIKKTSDSQKAAAPQADPLLHEYQMLRSLNESSDPRAKYFPRIIGLGPDFLAIEHFESKTLAEVYREKSLTPARARVIQRQLQEAVEALTEAGISHGDINPTNILVLPDDSLKLVDFGIAVRLGEHHVSVGSHGFNSKAQRAAGGGKTDASRAIPLLDNAAGYDGVMRTISLNIREPQTTYVDTPTSPYEAETSPSDPPASPQ
jgi:serine/threonine protein kinase